MSQGTRCAKHLCHRGRDMLSEDELIKLVGELDTDVMMVLGKCGHRVGDSGPNHGNGTQHS